MDKDYGVNHYENKIKKKNNHGKPYNNKERIGNSYSGGRYRPSYNLNATKISKIQEKMAAEQHHVVDFTVNSTMFRKSSTPQDVRHNPQDIINRIKNVDSTKKRKVKFNPKIIHLNGISKNLFLGNLDSYDVIEDELNGVLEVGEPYTLINLSVVKLIKKKSRTNRQEHNTNMGNGIMSSYSGGCGNSFDRRAKNKINFLYNISFRDLRFCRYKDFLDSTNECLRIMEESDRYDRKVILICEDGINKSVSIALCYAILKKNISYFNSTSEIDRKKLKKYKNWDNLTNKNIKNYIRAYTQCKPQ